MATIKSIALSNLLIDTQNPRLENIIEGQNDALRVIAKTQNRKLLVLAKDISKNGLSPIDLPIVMPVDEENRRFVVLEGNRRIAALKILENPEIIRGAVRDTLFKAFKQLGTEYQKQPIELIDCVVVSSREEADHWIELRHTGENEGAGIVSWGATEIERFRERRRGAKSPSLQILQFLEEKKIISPETRRKVPITSLKRLIKTPYIRKQLGIAFQNGVVVTNLPEKEVLKGLKRIVEDLASGKIKVPDIYYEKDRRKYIDSIAEDLPDKSKAFEEFFALSETPPEEKIAKTRAFHAKSSRPSRKKRITLIPIRGFSLSINQSRINDIYYELKRLKVDDFPNAVSVLFRVFIELSVDEYIERHNLEIDPRSSLSHKILTVAKHLKDRNLLNDQQLKVIRRYAQSNSFLGTTLTTMHQYVHNKYFHPAPGDLFASWDSLEPFFVAIWNR